ncbi:response regulator [Zhongshania guokunii]|uniref:histidine kinase n=1 Tax=Zhongshania guokunii TaxID=641783 RepID=A0ABV3U4V8_9GAMM
MLCLGAAVQASPVLTLDSSQNSSNLAQYSDILSDPDKIYRIQDILSPALNAQFRPSESGDFQLAGNSRYWFRFTLHNSSDKTQRHLLQVLPDNPKFVQLYQGDESIAAFATAKLIRSETLFAINLEAHSSASYYLVAEYSFPRRMAIELHSYASFLGGISKREFINAVFYGILTLLLIFNVISALLHKEALFANQAAYSGLIIICQLLAWGYIGEAQGLLPPWQGSGLIVALMSIAIIDLLYARYFPIYPTHQPGRWLNATRFMLVFNTLFIAIAIIGDSRNISMLMHFVVPANTLLLFGMALHCYLQSYSRLIFYYLITRSSIILIYILSLLSYYLNITDIRVVNTILVAMATATGISHTSLLLARHHYRMRKQMQDEQRIAILGEVNRAKTDVLARITHDIRTPLSAMLGVTELLQDTRLTASQEDYISTLQRSSHELLQLLDEASQAARFSESDVELSNQLINLPEIIDESLAGFRNIAAEQAIELICDIDSMVSEQLIGDPSRIRQLLSHAMNSAFEHYETGFILLKVYPAETKPGLLFFDLSHHGKPFSAQEKQALSRSISDDSSIVNARFAIAAQLISLMRGQVSVRTSPNGAHILSFSLQLGAPKNHEHNHLAATELLNGKRLLVVDNNQTFCKVLSKQCSNWGMEVFTANSDNAAVALVRNQSLLQAPIEILLIDQALASGGLKLAKRIQIESQAQNLQTITLMLAHANINFERDELHSAGIRRVLSKPLSSVALRSALLNECHFDASVSHRSPDQYSTDALNLSSLRCLIAEDNPTNAQVLTRMLSSLGIEVHHVENGQQAVNTFMRSRFDFVIMDIEMPIMDGAEATRLIRQFEEEEGRERTPIFGLTANSLDEQRDSYFRAGMDLHLVKPIRLWELAEAIKRWTGYQHQKT